MSDLPAEIEFVPVPPGLTEPALQLILADPDRQSAGPINVAAFHRLAREENYNLEKMLVARQAGRLLHACLFVPAPGRTAFIFAAPPPGHLEAALGQAVAAENLRQLTAWALRENNQIMQVMAEPRDQARQDLCRAAGYHFLTDLIYLIRMMDRPVPQVAIPPGVTWLTYAPEHHDLFRDTIIRTYRDSHDCPELENLRDPEDTIRGHKAAGIFDPRLWRLLFHNGNPAGVVLLSRLRNDDLMELTYMGLVPEARRHGLGRVLLHEALVLTRETGVNCLSLAVDSRNEAAFRLYTDFSLTFLIRRSVWIFSPRW